MYLNAGRLRASSKSQIRSALCLFMFRKFEISVDLKALQRFFFLSLAEKKKKKTRLD